MKILEIKERLYSKFGAGGNELMPVLIHATRSPRQNLHKIAEITGIGYRTVRDVVNLFIEDISVNLNTDEISVSNDFTREINGYNKLKINNFSFYSERLEIIINGLHQHNLNLDHISATPICCFRRATDLIENYDIDNCKFLFLGDHDLTSLTFAMLCDSLNKHPKITVIDIDDSVLSYINRCSEINCFNIETYYSDFRLCVPKNLSDSFDVIFTDPPYTYEGIGTFLAKANQLIKKNPFSSVLICYKAAEQSAGLGLQVQKMISQMGLYIREMKKNFNKYKTAEAIGCSSDLYYCVPTASIKTEIHFSKDIMNIYSHGSNAVEKNGLNKDDLSINKIPLLIGKRLFYIGENPLEIFTDKLKIRQYINQVCDGKFHYVDQKTYLVDIRITDDDALRLLLLCDFNEYYVIANSATLCKRQEAFFSIIQTMYSIKRVYSHKDYSVYLFVRNNTDNLLANAIGKRAILRNHLVKEFCRVLGITQNDARNIIDGWGYSAISKVSLYFVPDNIIYKLNKAVDNSIEPFKKE